MSEFFPAAGPYSPSDLDWVAGMFPPGSEMLHMVESDPERLLMVVYEVMDAGAEAWEERVDLVYVVFHVGPQLYGASSECVGGRCTERAPEPVGPEVLVTGCLEPGEGVEAARLWGSKLRAMGPQFLEPLLTAGHPVLWDAAQEALGR